MNIKNKERGFLKMNNLLNICIFLIIIIVAIYLQIYLSKKSNQWLGLILPSICLIFIILIIFGIVISSTIFTLIICIITLILLTIYFYCRRKFKSNAQIEKMNIQDL